MEDGNYNPACRSHYNDCPKVTLCDQASKISDYNCMQNLSYSQNITIYAWKYHTKGRGVFFVDCDADMCKVQQFKLVLAT